MILSGKSSRQDHAEEDGFAKVDTFNQTFLTIAELSPVGGHPY
jgi:hypothetical protein